MTDAFVSVLALAVLVLACAFTAADALGDTDVPYGVGTWPETLGNHRTRVRVDAAADAVRVHIPWRRRDADPERKGVIVHALASGKPVRNVARVRVAPEAGDIVFQPEAGVGEYAVYYLPVSITGWEYMPTVEYPAPVDTADPAWLARNRLDAAGLASGSWRELPEATLLAIEARGEFQRRDPMELPATEAELQTLLAAHPDDPYLLFPEDREHSIRMSEAIPYRWVRRGPSSEFVGTAKRGEFYVLQIGLYAARGVVRHVRVRFSALKSADGGEIPARAIRCLNRTGVDWRGHPFVRDVGVPGTHVQPLWIGIDVPEGAPPGQYQGAVTIQPAGDKARAVHVRLTVTPEAVTAHGEDDIRSLARLRWLDSTIGLDNQVTKPFEPVSFEHGTARCLQRSVKPGADGLPASIVSWGHELLAHPIRMSFEMPTGAAAFRPGRLRHLQRGPDAVEWYATCAGDGVTIRTSAQMEYDGHLTYAVKLQARKDVTLTDARLEIPLRRDTATYLVGMGKEGGYRPKEWRWKWNIDQTNNMVWVGTPEAGIRCKLTGPPSAGTLYSLHEGGVPPSWSNGGQGGCEIVEDGRDTVLIRAYTGPRTIRAGEEITFHFSLLITPIKPLDAGHWGWRYYHFGAQVVPIGEIAATGARVVNIHQGNDLNRYINYPFQNVDRLEPYVREAHAKGLKAKIYYTVRELSNYCAELWALRSLGHEVLADGGGGGDPWLQEHLVSHFGVAWRQPYADGETDAAIATTGMSRWHNYYLEGLSWLIRKVGIDGLYLDGIGYDRRTVQRVRKVMDRARPGCLLDFHSGNELHPEYGMSSPINKYMEHLPYIDSLWLGEGYDYNKPPDYWLVEISGLPFGLYSEMLQDGGNPWRGMVFGMTNRLGWGGDPRPVWRIWDEFGIAEATPRFYFQKDCPVRTGRDDVLASAYVRKDRTLIAIASWAKDAVRLRLQVDWKALGLDPAATVLRAPDAPGFQSVAVFSPNDEVPVEPGRGWLLVAEAKR